MNSLEFFPMIQILEIGKNMVEITRIFEICLYTVVSPGSQFAQSLPLFYYLFMVLAIESQIFADHLF